MLSDTSYLISKKSEFSILGLECTNLLRRIATELNPKPTTLDPTQVLVPTTSSQIKDLPEGLSIFQEVVKFLKLFAKRKQIYGSNLCYLNGMTI